MEILYWYSLIVWTLYGLASVRFACDRMDEGDLTLRWVRDQAIAWATTPLWAWIALVFFVVAGVGYLIIPKKK